MEKKSAIQHLCIFLLQLQIDARHYVRGYRAHKPCHLPKPSALAPYVYSRRQHKLQAQGELPGSLEQLSSEQPTKPNNTLFP